MKNEENTTRNDWGRFWNRCFFLAQDLQKDFAAYQKGFAAYEAGDYATALEEWKPLVEQGNADVQRAIGVMYALGQGVPQDSDYAGKWWRLAAGQGDADAQNNLGAMYKYGYGVTQSNVMAHMWFNIASANGASKAGEWRDSLADEMTSAEITKAREMAVECMNSDYENCGW